MNIWMVNHYALPPSLPGGTRHFCLARELNSRGHNTSIIAANCNHINGRVAGLAPGKAWAYTSDQGVPFLWLKSSRCGRSGLSRLANMLSFASRAGRGVGTENLPKPDLIYAASPHHFAASSVRKLARRHRVPYILEVGDLWPETLIELGGFSAWHPLILALGRMERSLYRSADGIVTLLPGSEEHIIERGGNRETITAIPNGVDMKSVPELRPVSRGSGPFTIVYAGAHGFANGLDTALDAAVLLASRAGAENIRFRFIGSGVEKERLMQRALDENLNNVVFEDSVPKAKIFDALMDSHACYLPLLKSPLFEKGISPNKLYDYMASGRPVIFAVSSRLNPVESAQCGLTIKPDDPEAVADAAINLARMDPDEADAMGSRGRQFVEHKHGFERLAEDLESFILRIVEERDL